MKLISKLLFILSILILASCQDTDELLQTGQESIDFRNQNSQAFFEFKNSIQVGGEGASEISAFCSLTNKLFIVNVLVPEISVYNISDINQPVAEASIPISSGSPNSIAIHKGKLAVAIEASNKQLPGSVKVYDTKSQLLLDSYTVGSLPDMVIFSPNGQFIITANEGEPNDLYTVDPEGSISIITTATQQVTTLTFNDFNGQEAQLKSQGLRIFGPGASLAQDLEPEYVAISDNSSTAWVSLQENNGIARVNLLTKQIEGIFPLGFKDHSLMQNSLDASDADGVKELKTWPVLGMYQPDALAYAKINGMDLIFSANEGDARDYDGYSEEVRVKDLDLDASVYDPAENYQGNSNLGRLKTTTANGDDDGNGLVEQIYCYGGRSFSIWGANGELLYDSGNEIGARTKLLTEDRFNDDDSRSDDKGAEPETVTLLELPGKRFYLFVGLERNDQTLVYDVSNPFSPQFVQILYRAGDEAPEGILAVPAKDSPTGSDLLIISNEDSGTVSIYENIL